MTTDEKQQIVQKIDKKLEQAQAITDKLCLYFLDVPNQFQEFENLTKELKTVNKEVDQNFTMLNKTYQRPSLKRVK
jgi:uncharacterized protein (DUF2344 family)